MALLGEPCKVCQKANLGFLVLCLAISVFVSASHRRSWQGRTTKAQSGAGVEGRVLYTVRCKRFRFSVQRTLNTEDVASRGSLLRRFRTMGTAEQRTAISVEGCRDPLIIFETVH